MRKDIPTLDKVDWGDLQVLRAFAEHGSVARAAGTLRLSHQTVGRRLAGLEAALGVRLINRDLHPFGLTALGEQVARQAQAMADIMAETLALTRQSSGMSGRVSISSTGMGFELLVIPAIARLQTNHPDLTFTLVADDGQADLGRGHIDLALRFTNDPPQDAIGHKLGELRFGLFGRPKALADFESARTKGDSPCRVVEMADPRAHRPGLAALGLSEALVTHVSDFSTLVAAVAQGLGVGVLPLAVGARMQQVELCNSLKLPMKLGIWSLKHPSARTSAKLLACERAIADQARQVLGDFA